MLAWWKELILVGEPLPLLRFLIGDTALVCPCRGERVTYFAVKFVTCVLLIGTFLVMFFWRPGLRDALLRVEGLVFKLIETFCIGLGAVTEKLWFGGETVIGLPALAESTSICCGWNMWMALVIWMGGLLPPTCSLSCSPAVVVLAAVLMTSNLLRLSASTFYTHLSYRACVMSGTNLARCVTSSLLGS